MFHSIKLEAFKGSDQRLTSRATFWDHLMQNSYAFGQSTLLVAASALLLSGCGQDESKGKAQTATVQCGSSEASNALKRYVMNAASQTAGSNAQVGVIAEYLEAVSMSAEEQDQPAFDRALQSVSTLESGGSPSGNGANIKIDEVTDLGLAEDGSIRCWASLIIALPPATQKSLDDLKQVLWADHNIDASSLGGSLSIKVFYALASSPRLMVSEADLSKVDMARMSDLIRLGDAATFALAPVNAIKQRQEGYAKELDQAKGAVLGVSLDEAKLILRQYDTQLGEIWRGLDDETRKSLLAEQRIWLRRRAATCDFGAKSETTDPVERELIHTRCLANATLNRVKELSRY